jgi:uncharacterized protein YjiS (DUF1127 family)
MRTYLEAYTQASLSDGAENRLGNTRDLTISISAYRLIRWVITNIDAMIVRVQLYRERRYTVLALSKLDDHVLKDIGVQRLYLADELDSDARIARRIHERPDTTLVA